VGAPVEHLLAVAPTQAREYYFSSPVQRILLDVAVETAAAMALESLMAKASAMAMAPAMASGLRQAPQPSLHLTKCLVCWSSHFWAVC